MTKEKTSVNRRELAKVVAEKHDLSQGKADEIVKTFLDEVVNALDSGKEVHLANFAKFELVDRKARTMNSFGNEIEVPAKTVVKVRNRGRLLDITKEA